MIRDPFDIHRRNLIQATAAAASHTANNIRQTAAQVGADMSFTVPRRVPDFDDTDRALEDHAWSSLRGAGARVQGRVTGLFEAKSLPMYKDKPFTRTPSYRNRPLWRKKRTLGTLVLLVLSVLYFLGFFSSRSRSETRPSKSGWSWPRLDTGKADWDQRRQRVVEAFQLSWDAYERYAWGRSTPRATPPTNPPCSPPA